MTRLTEQVLISAITLTLAAVIAGVFLGLAVFITYYWSVAR